MNNYLRLMASNRTAAPRSLAPRAASDGSVDVFLYDLICADDTEAQWFGGVAPLAFVQALREINAAKINLRINSPGGSVFGARAIEAALREHPATITAHIDGVAASAATFIATACDEVVMADGALFMVHKSWSGCYGNADDMIETAALLEKIDETMVGTYAKKCGQPKDQIEAWMRAETWFNAQEAVDAGFADRIAEDDTADANARWDLSAYARAPKLPEPKPAPAPKFAKADRGALLRQLEVAALV